MTADIGCAVDLDDLGDLDPDLCHLDYVDNFLIDYPSKVCYCFESDRSLAFACVSDSHIILFCFLHHFTQ